MESIKFSNNVTNIRLHQGNALNGKPNPDTVRLLEVLHNKLEIIQCVVEDLQESRIFIVNAYEVKFPELILSTQESRKEIEENGGDLESLYSDANFLVIE